ncbi:MAG TPA: MFS transporter, partial [Pyrinomonadaceae bacterium]|nr:MFS transporter [Pyrinomonadaceae bacterium]
MNEVVGKIEEVEEPKSQSNISPPQEAGGSFGGSVTAAAGEVVGHIGRRRWMICALLFFAATINYIDRQVIGILKPTLQAEFAWSEVAYGWIVFSFQTAYAIGLLMVGRLMDKVGTKIGFALSIIVWSIAAMGHAFAVGIGVATFGIAAGLLTTFGYDPATSFLSASVLGFMIARFALGLGEAGNFPASIKSVSEWFPKKERALATGIFNSGTNIGALATPLLVPIIVATWGWYEAFIITGALGFIWLIFWWVIYKKPEDDPKVSKAELDYIQSDPPEPTTRVPWSRLFPHRQTWAFGVGKFLTDPIWWVYLFWLPDFLNKQHGLDLKNFGIPLAVIYIIADVGSIGGGYISGALIKR